jgi:hypothetical protein
MLNLDVEKAKEFITEQFNLYKDTSWLEGFITGITFHLLGDFDKEYSILSHHLRDLRRKDKYPKQ